MRSFASITATSWDTLIIVILVLILVHPAAPFYAPLCPHRLSTRSRTHASTRTSVSLSSSTSVSASSKPIPRDVVIIGGGLAGLSTAYELSIRSTRTITVLTRPAAHEQEKTIASRAAAGMLAPQSERLPKGPLLDLCLQSRGLYSSYVTSLESLTGLSCGYRANGGFVAPAFRGDTVSTHAPPEGAGEARWLDEVQVKELEPRLSKDVIGGWWFAEDASVDSRLVHDALKAACAASGVEVIEGDVTAVEGSTCGVSLSDGRCYKGRDVVIANGSWMRELLPVPVQPHKGQSFSVRAPEKFLERVLFASDTYVVPKSDGRIVIGATVEPGR